MMDNDNSKDNDININININIDINIVAMNIIMDAGDARALIQEVLSGIENNQFQQANEKITQAQLKIKSAHQTQTQIVQSEIRGHIYPHSLLFIHAQDTLMSINSELLITKKLLKICQMLDKRLIKLEQQLQPSSTA